jgi:uncharacterized coiled-coil protein SlyX
MGKTPPPPKSQTADYFFCRNTKCSFHAMFLLKDKPKEMVQGAPCPVCKEGKLEVVELETTAPVTPAASTEPATGILLPVPPYGGFTLTFGDNDETQTWEQVTGHPEPRHQNARYVAELQRDLMRLGFYSHGREAGSDKAGDFTLSVMSGVLDLKRHLSEVYGFPISEDMEAVKKAADAGAGPIYYRKMKNPAIAFNRTVTWTNGVTGMRKAIDAWAKLWAESQKPGKAKTMEEVEALEAERVQLAADLAALKARRQKMRTDVDLAQNTTLPGVKRKLVMLKAEVKTAADPEALKKEITDLETRIKQIETEITTINSDITKQKQQIDQIEQKLNGLPGKIKVAKDRIKKRDEAYSAMVELAGRILTQSKESTELIQQLAHRPPTHFNVKLSGPPTDYQGDRANAISAVKKVLKDDGAAAALPARAAEIEKGWTEAKVPAPSDWADFKTKLGAIRASLTEYLTAADDPATERSKLYDGYRQELREFAKVDAATARMIRQMVWTGQLAGRAVFWLPMDEEISRIEPGKAEETMKALVDELGVANTVAGGKKVVRKSGNSPIQLLDFIFIHESGGQHSKRFGGRDYVTIGIDWANTGDKSMFKENITNPERWSFSRGWGLTQKTFFDGPMKMRDANGKMRDYEMHAGIPYVPTGDTTRPLPEAISSARANMSSGVSLYLQTFNYSQQKRDCTYKQPYDCAKCARNFAAVPRGSMKGGKFVPERKDSSILFDDAKTDFERVKKEGHGTIAMRMKDGDKVRDLVNRGEYKVDGYDGSSSAPEAVRTEFPCSWVTSVLRYAGSGEQAYLYGLEAVWTVAGKPAPPA